MNTPQDKPDYVGQGAPRWRPVEHLRVDDESLASGWRVLPDVVGDGDPRWWKLK